MAALPGGRRITVWHRKGPRWWNLPANWPLPPAATPWPA